MRNIFLFISSFFMAINVCAHQIEIPEMYIVGEYKVYVLTETKGEGNTQILINATEEIMQKNAPNSTFPSAIRAILIEKEGEKWLVDTGFGTNIFEQMSSIDISREDVNHVLLTHMHGDHIGGMLWNGKPAFPNADVMLSEKEYEYWTSEEEMLKKEEKSRGNFISAQNIFNEYGDKIKIQKPHDLGNVFVDGIHMIEAYGHTPGHVMYFVKDENSKLLIWGDLTHVITVQMPHPEISVTYDVDPDMARTTRLKVLNHVSENRISVAGMHIPFTGMGMVVKGESPEGYVFESF